MKKTYCSIENDDLELETQLRVVLSRKPLLFQLKLHKDVRDNDGIKKNVYIFRMTLMVEMDISDRRKPVHFSSQPIIKGTKRVRDNHSHGEREGATLL